MHAGGDRARRRRMGRTGHGPHACARPSTRPLPLSTGMSLVAPRNGGIHRIVSILLTAAIFALILRRVPFSAVEAALHDADLPRFLALMIGNTAFYFAWDTLVLAVAVRWFHGGVPYRELLPVRAVSYVVGF